MISSIGPFWDANETWLVLAIGLLLVAFPAARHNRPLYLPVAAMLIGLILRGVAFEYRVKARQNGSRLGTGSSGGLHAGSPPKASGMYIMGLEWTI